MAYPKKVMIFIDGSNFYHALKNLGVTSIDFKHLCDSLIGRERELVRVYYYNAPVNQSEEPERYKRQQKFFNSADGDFADVVQRVKDLGKHVEVAYPEGGRLYHLRQV